MKHSAQTCLHTGIALFLLIFPVFLSAQQSPYSTFTLKTETHKGYGPFPIGLTFMLEADKRDFQNPTDAGLPKLTGIPDSLSQLMVQTELTDFIQVAFQQYKQGKLDTAYFESLYHRFEVDTTRLSSQPVKSYISVAAGYDSQQRPVAVVDANNNQDFGDDVLHYLAPAPSFKEETSELLQTLIPFETEIYDGTSIQKRTSWLHLSPLEEDSQMGEYAANLTTKIALNKNFGEYKTCTLSLGDTTYTLGITFGFSSYSYRFANIAVLEKTTTGWKPGPRVKLGQYLILKDNYLRFEHITTDGSEITLVLDPKGSEVEKAQLGLMAPSFAGTTLSGESINLTDYRGKYVYMDFWGSWCKPCLEEIPELKRVYDIFEGEHFSLLGIAYDDSTQLVTYLEKTGVKWPQILQSADTPEDNYIVQKYDVSGYPTPFLIDPNGKVIDISLRGSDIAPRLTKLLPLTASMKEKLLTGKDTFSLSGYEDEENMELKIYQDATEQEHPMLFIDGKWQLALDLEPGEYHYEFSFKDQSFPDPNGTETIEMEGRKLSSITVR